MGKRTYTTFTSATPGKAATRKNYKKMKVAIFKAPNRKIGFSKQGELKVCDVNTAVVSDNGQSGGILVRDSNNISSAVSSAAAQATTQVVCLNTMAQGTDFTGRVGRKILAKSVLLDAEIYPVMTTSTGGFADIVRCIVFWDYQSNGKTTFPLSDLLLDQGATPLTNTTSPINLQNRDRFKILFDKRYNMNPYAVNSGAYVSGGAPHPINIKKYIKLGNVSTTFNDTGSSVYGDVQSGALMAVFFSESDSNCRLMYTARTRFIDA